MKAASDVSPLRLDSARAPATACLPPSVSEYSF